MLQVASTKSLAAAASSLIRTMRPIWVNRRFSSRKLPLAGLDRSQAQAGPDPPPDREEYRNDLRGLLTPAFPSVTMHLG